MQEENPLAETPQGSSTELIRTRVALRNAIGKILTHVVYEEIREQIGLLFGEAGEVGILCGQRGRMAQTASGALEQIASVGDGWSAGRGSGRSQQPHERCKILGSATGAAVIALSSNPR